MPNVEVNGGAVAVRFSEDEAPRGWKVLDSTRTPLTARLVDDELVYIFRGDRWDKIRRALYESDIPYRYKISPAGFSKPALEDPDTWTSVQPEACSGSHQADLTVKY